MTNRYDIEESTEQAPRPEPSTGQRGGIFRPLVWILLVASAAANIITSSTGTHVLIGIGFGLLTLVFIVTLVVDHYTHRAR